MRRSDEAHIGCTHRASTQVHFLDAADRKAAYVTDRSHTPADFACTIYHLLGIDQHKYYLAPNGQPTPIVRDGEVTRAVLG